jgi:hypothetical protein
MCKNFHLRIGGEEFVLEIIRNGDKKDRMEKVT